MKVHQNLPKIRKFSFEPGKKQGISINGSYAEQDEEFVSRFIEREKKNRE